jgi:hypothetical protein
MKQIEITGKTNQKIYLEDDDNTHVESYTKTISGLLESKNVIVLHTSSSSIVIRPSDIFSIEVKNRPEILKDENLPLEQELVNLEQEIIKEKKEEIPEDTLTDMS